MSEVLSIATAVPEHCVSTAEATTALAGVLSASSARRCMDLARASGGETRHAILPLAELRRLDTLEARNRAYVEHAARLGEAVARRALHDAAVDRHAIGAIVGVSSTGFAMPTVETILLDRLRLSSACRRVPLTQLGCAGGAAGLGVAAALSGAPGGHALVVSVELPSLSFPNAEPSPTDVIAALQFGDGAAAAVVSADDTARGPQIVASGSVLFPGTLDRNEVQLTSAGLRLMRPRGLGEILRRQLGAAVDGFLARSELTRADIAYWAIHPRSPELIDAAGASLDLPESALDASRTVWRRRGNMISASIFHVLDALRASRPPGAGDLGMMIAFGAGFGCEMVLLRAAGWLSH